MPEHVHLIVTPTGITLERAMQFIKGGYSYSLRKVLERQGEVWQRGFSDHRIRDAADFAAHREYVENNPVKRGLCPKKEEYRYSSAYPGFRLDARPAAAKAA
jgi:putative transposase